MPAADLGAKFVCYKCTTKFYDMKKPEPVCPKCGTDQRESPANRPVEKTRGRLAAVPKVVEPIVPAEEAAETEEDEIEELVEEEPAAAVDEDV